MAETQNQSNLRVLRSPWAALPDFTDGAAGVNKGFHYSAPFSACFLEELNICVLRGQGIQDPCLPSECYPRAYFILSPGALLSLPAASSRASPLPPALKVKGK